MKEKTNRDKWLHIRLTEAELKTIQDYFEKSTCRKLSEYARIRLLDKPLVTIYRNRSMDDFMTEMMKLRVDLNAIGNNFNQSVKKLHVIHNEAESNQWVTGYKAEREAMQMRVECIKVEIEKFAKTWLQSLKPDRQ